MLINPKWIKKNKIRTSILDQQQSFMTVIRQQNWKFTCIHEEFNDKFEKEIRKSKAHKIKTTKTTTLYTYIATGSLCNKNC